MTQSCHATGPREKGNNNSSIKISSEQQLPDPQNEKNAPGELLLSGGFAAFVAMALVPDRKHLNRPSTK